MATKRLTPVDVAELLSAKAGLSVEQVKALLTAQAELAYANAETGYPIPGIGTMLVEKRPERSLRLSIGPRQGQVVTVPAKHFARFRFSRIAKEMLLSTNPPSLPDLFQCQPAPQLEYSVQAIELPNSSSLVSDLGISPVQKGPGNQTDIRAVQLQNLRFPTGRIIASDPLIGSGTPFSRTVLPGEYPLVLVIARTGGDERIALAMIRFSEQPVTKWEPAVCEGRSAESADSSRSNGYGVDSGTGSFYDAAVQQLLTELGESGVDLYDLICDEMKSVYKPTRDWVHVKTPNGSLAVFSSGHGDGVYSSYFGLDGSGNPAALVTDFKLVKWGPTAIGKH